MDMDVDMNMDMEPIRERRSVTNARPVLQGVP